MPEMLTQVLLSHSKLANVRSVKCHRAAAPIGQPYRDAEASGVLCGFSTLCTLKRGYSRIHGLKSPLGQR